jgi:hypothetical protein
MGYTSFDGSEVHFSDLGGSEDDRVVAVDVERAEGDRLATEGFRQSHHPAVQVGEAPRLYPPHEVAGQVLQRR